MVMERKRHRLSVNRGLLGGAEFAAIVFELSLGVKDGVEGVHRIFGRELIAEFTDSRQDFILRQRLTGRDFEDSFLERHLIASALAGFGTALAFDRRAASGDSAAKGGFDLLETSDEGLAFSLKGVTEGYVLF